MPKHPRIIGLIPARGGSKGLPRKNITQLAGKPLIAWTIETAVESNCLDRVIVSTDDLEIARISEEYGAEVPFIRPEEYASDSATSLSVVQHAIEYLRSNGISDKDFILLLQPTSPLRNSTDIINSVKLLELEKVNAVVSVFDAPCHPYYLKRVTHDGFLFPYDESAPDNFRRQDCPKLFIPNGAIYLNQICSLIDKKTFFPLYTYAYIMPNTRSIDIDSIEDLVIAEAMFQLIKPNNYRNML